MKENMRRSRLLFAASVKRLFSTLLPIFGVFFKIGLFTFGGGLEMLPLFKRELVTKHNWISKDMLMDVIAISQSIPGSLTINSAAFLGRAIAGIPGAIIAIGGAVAAPMVCITAVIAIQPWIQGNVYVEHFFAGVRAAVAGLILSALLDLRKHVLHSKADYVVMIGAFIAMEVFKVHFVYIILAGILCSLFLHYLSRKNKMAAGIALALNLIVSLCNYTVWYVFWAMFLFAYISYRYDIRKHKKEQRDDESADRSIYSIKKLLDADIDVEKEDTHV